ncbi:MAG: hypothetical protein B7Y83_09600 [Flavobacteriales bacterium 32-34-25]|nr:MAG: hypothetical protein B7Y83_09600 [Flavobacteriales bacterium 32-34-25]
MKTNLLTTTLILLSIASYSQIIEPTRYNLDSLHYPTTKKDYKYIRVVENYKNQPNLFIFTEYYRSGKLSMKAISTKYEEPIFEGPRIDYYENGNKKRETQYSKNRINGQQVEWYKNQNKKSEKTIKTDPKTSVTVTQILQYWNENNEQKVIDGNGFYEETNGDTFEKGEIRNSRKQGVWTGKNNKTNSTFTETYENGELLHGVSIDSNNIEHPYQVLFKKPEFKEGMTAFYQFIGKNYRLPNGVQAKPGEKPKLIALFNVDTDGKLVDIKIVNDLGHGTGEEAIRVLKKAPNWIPGIFRGMYTKTTYSLPITIHNPEN